MCGSGLLSGARSDRIEEDEIDDEIVKVLCNKTADNRQLQEEDVMTRAAQAQAGQALTATLADGTLDVRVEPDIQRP